MYRTNVVDRTDLGTATRHPEDFGGANDIFVNLPIERETRVEISRTHVIFDYYLFYRNNIFLRLYSTISFLDTVVQLAKWKMTSVGECSSNSLATRCGTRNLIYILLYSS